jgi:hypothetical protein
MVLALVPLLVLPTFLLGTASHLVAFLPTWILLVLPKKLLLVTLVAAKEETSSAKALKAVWIAQGTVMNGSTRRTATFAPTTKLAGSQRSMAVTRKHSRTAAPPALPLQKLALPLQKLLTLPLPLPLQ